MNQVIRLFQSKREISIPIVGLDGSGKTSIANRLSGLPVHDDIHTFGLNTLFTKKGRYDINFFDLAGEKSIRDVWESVYAKAHGVIFVLDSTNPFRILEAKSFFNMLLEGKYMKNKPILIFANKSDKKTSMTKEQLDTWFNIEDLCKFHSYLLVRASAIENRSVNRGIKWLLKNIEERYEILEDQLAGDGRKRKKRFKKGNALQEKESLKRYEEGQSFIRNNKKEGSVSIPNFHKPKKHLKRTLKKFPSDDVELNSAANTFTRTHKRLKPILKKFSSSDIRLDKNYEMLDPPPEKIEPTDEGLHQTLEKLEPSLIRLEPSLQRLEPSLIRLEPSLIRLEPSLIRLEPALQKLEPALEKLEPSLIRLEPALQKLQQTLELLEPSLTKLKSAHEILEPSNKKL